MREDRFRAMLGDFLEDSLDASQRREMEAHLKSCEPCRTLLADLREIQRAAASLPRLASPPGVWDRIRDSLPSPPSAERSSPRISPWSHRWALAASLIILLGGLALAYALGLFPRQAPPEDSAEYVSTELQLAENHYQNAIRGLEQIVDEGQSTLDPEVATVLRQNIDLIESAIDESRTAARQEPTNPAAGESLLAALRRKVSLLQNTVLLINEIRKGQREAAANILNEMRDSEPAGENNSS